MPQALVSNRPARCHRTLRTSTGWCDYFRSNALRLPDLPWDQGVRLSDCEKQLVASSIRTFQLGESGSGNHILRAADRYALQSGDTQYPNALRLFLGEEHRHAAHLGRLLDAAGIPRLKRQWSDSAFRSLRHFGGLESAICILLTAELIAMIYYAALRNATQCPLLRGLCRQILRDEVAHIRFQTERLALLRRGRCRVAIRCVVFLQVLLFAATCAAFWIDHRKVLRAGGFSLKRFTRRARHEMQSARGRVDPVMYSVRHQLVTSGDPAHAAALWEA